MLSSNSLHHSSKDLYNSTFSRNIQGVREISVIIVTDDYLCYKEPKIPYNFVTYFNI